ncbi:hypothetical protein [Candidatus Endomicrobiellum trichonymphae]|uniref:hypothetical protein n=1 Tax=Endomicrobium trichonymphae TaxID=1408204 RepID=UPI0039B8B94F
MSGVCGKSLSEMVCKFDAVAIIGGKSVIDGNKCKNCKMYRGLSIECCSENSRSL